MYVQNCIISINIKHIYAFYHFILSFIPCSSVEYLYFCTLFLPLFSLKCENVKKQLYMSYCYCPEWKVYCITVWCRFRLCCCTLSVCRNTIINSCNPGRHLNKLINLMLTELLIEMYAQEFPVTLRCSIFRICLSFLVCHREEIWRRESKLLVA